MTATKTKQLQEVLTRAHHDYERGLKARALFKLSDHALGEDLVQNTFLKTWNYLVKGGKVQTMKAFLYHIFNNLIVDEYRKHKTTSLDVMLEKGFEPSVDDSSRIINILDGKKVLVSVEHLPKIYKKVISMKYVKDLSLQEISVVTGISKSTIAVQLHRGIEKLKLLHNYT